MNSFSSGRFPIYLLLRWRETMTCLFSTGRSIPVVSNLFASQVKRNRVKDWFDTTIQLKRVSNLFASQVKRNLITAQWQCVNCVRCALVSNLFASQVKRNFKWNAVTSPYWPTCFQSICFSGEEKLMFGFISNLFTSSFQSICFSGEEKPVDSLVQFDQVTTAFPIYLLLRWRETYIYVNSNYLNAELRVSNLFASQVKRNRFSQINGLEEEYVVSNLFASQVKRNRARAGARRGAVDLAVLARHAPRRPVSNLFASQVKRNN